MLKKFYFTYETRSELQYPYQNGWTEVLAPDIATAVAGFRAYHPDKTAGIVNCRSFCTEDEFKVLNLDPEVHKCHETITIAHSRVIHDDGTE